MNIELYEGCFILVTLYHFNSGVFYLEMVSSRQFNNQGA